MIKACVKDEFTDEIMSFIRDLVDQVIKEDDLCVF